MRSFLERLRNAFLFERIACRLILAWSCFIISTLEEKGAYAQLGWMQNAELLTLALVTVGFFLLFSLPAILFKKINTDALFLLLTSTYCIGYWCAYAPSANREWFMLSAIVIYSLFLVYCIRALANVWSYVKMHTPVAIILATVAGLVCFGGRETVSQLASSKRQLFRDFKQLGKSEKQSLMLVYILQILIQMRSLTRLLMKLLHLMLRTLLQAI